MWWRALGVVMLLAVGGSAVADSASPPPAWITVGFTSAIQDPGAQVGAFQLNFSGALLSAIPTDQRGDVINKLFRLLESSDDNARTAAARALAAIPPNDRRAEAIEKLMPLLSSTSSPLQTSAAQALTAISIPPGDQANHAIDQLLLLLKQSPSFETLGIQAAAARAMGTIPSGDRVHDVIDSLVPLLAACRA